MTTYHSYLLQMRQVANGNKPRWVFCLIDSETQAILRFATLEAVVNFLQSQMEVLSHAST
jgi:hypothetical protein